MLPVPAVIVSETLQRFQRARNILTSDVFSPILHFPAVFFKNKTKGCNGVDGHRVAMRNTWLFVTLFPWACVFEDDIVRTTSLMPNVPALLSSRYDVVFLGNLATLRNKTDDNEFYTAHAQCISKRGARILLDRTNRCIPKEGATVDFWIMKMCRNLKLRCKAGINAFTQDRVNVPPYLHSPTDQFIGQAYG